MSSSSETAVPTARKKRAHGKGRSDATLGHASQNTSSPEGAKESVGLPVGWQQLTLGTECDILAGFGFPERFQGKSIGDLPFFKVGDISETWKRGDVFLTRANHYVSHAESRELRAKPLPANTTVFAKIGAAIALNRRAILSDASLVDNNVMGLHPASDKLDYKFLFHFVCTLKLDELSRATTVPSIRKSDIEAITIPVPPPPEQRRIVAEIEKQFTRLDVGVAALRRVQANLKRYRAAVLKAACEGRLVPTEAELAKTGNRKEKLENGEALLVRILAERRENWKGRGQYKEPARPDKTKLPQLPEGWTWTNIGQVTEVGTGATPNRGKSEYYVGGTIPWITSGRVNNPRVDEADQFVTSTALEQCNLTVYLPGTLLLAMYGEGKTRGMASELSIEASTNQALAAIQTPEAIRGFIKIVLWKNYEDVRKSASGGVQPNLNLSIVRAIPVPLPPLAEQTRIVAEVERRLSVVEEMEAMVSANLQRATRLRQSILQKAFTGKLAGAEKHQQSKAQRP